MNPFIKLEGKCIRRISRTPGAKGQYREVNTCVIEVPEEVRENQAILIT